MDNKRLNELKGLREGRVALLEKEDAEVFPLNAKDFVLPVQGKKPEIQKQNLIFDLKSVEKKDKIVETEIKKTEAPKTEIVAETFYEESLKKTESEEAAQKPKSKKFRLKLITSVFVLIVTMFTCVGISNAVEITRINAEVAAANQEYAINLEKYIKKISKLDKLTDEDVLDNVEIVSPIPPDRQISSTPEKIKNPAEITKISNWFNEILNKLSNLFRR
ncbi:MAG: hypothetical protein RR400_00215 [Clostridia bacterium]